MGGTQSATSLILECHTFGKRDGCWQVEIQTRDGKQTVEIPTDSNQIQDVSKLLTKYQAQRHSKARASGSRSVSVFWNHPQDAEPLRPILGQIPLSAFRPLVEFEATPQRPDIGVFPVRLSGARLLEQINEASFAIARANCDQLIVIGLYTAKKPLPLSHPIPANDWFRTELFVQLLHTREQLRDASVNKESYRSLDKYISGRRRLSAGGLPLSLDASQIGGALSSAGLADHDAVCSGLYAMGARYTSPSPKPNLSAHASSLHSQTQISKVAQSDSRSKESSDMQDIPLRSEEDVPESGAMVDDEPGSAPGTPPTTNEEKRPIGSAGEPVANDSVDLSAHNTRSRARVPASEQLASNRNPMTRVTTSDHPLANRTSEGEPDNDEAWDNRAKTGNEGPSQDLGRPTVRPIQPVLPAVPVQAVQAVPPALPVPPIQPVQPLLTRADAELPSGSRLPSHEVWEAKASTTAVPAWLTSKRTVPFSANLDLSSGRPFTRKRGPNDVY